MDSNLSKKDIALEKKPVTASDLLEKDNDVIIVGKCANCGVEYHIHKSLAQPKLISENENCPGV